MKKVILMLICILGLVGCTNIKELTYNDIVESIEYRSPRPNIYRTGYKYYIPRGVELSKSTLFNEILTSKNNDYYLYVDAISYHNKTEIEDKKDANTVYYENLEYKNKIGYIKIDLLKNGEYLIEIMYNYAKIEVIVEKNQINESLWNTISILKSIEYNDDIINSLLVKNKSNFIEEEFNIFDTTSNDSTYIKIDDTYEEVEEEIPDTDLIN